MDWIASYNHLEATFRSGLSKLDAVRATLIGGAANICHLIAGQGTLDYRGNLTRRMHTDSVFEQAPAAHAVDSVAEEPSPSGEVDTGLACFCMVARFHQVQADAQQVAHLYVAPGQVMRAPQMMLAAKLFGLHAKSSLVRPERLERTPLPAVAECKDGSFLIVARLTGDKVLIQAPRTGRPEAISVAELWERCSEQWVLFTSRASLAAGLSHFDFTWFIPAVVKYRWILAETVVVSAFIQILALLTPLFFQVVMDKVLVHRGLATLDVLAIGLLLVILFQSALSLLRTHVFSHTTSRIDVELGSRLFRHLLALPMAYFQVRRVGDSIARVRELESIRAFLTGSALTSVLDLAFAVLFLGVMYVYSPALTGVVAVSLLAYVVISLAFTPVLRARLKEKYERGAENQAFLVETVSGIETVKAMAVEPHWIRRWEAHLAGYVRAGFRASSVSSTAGLSVQTVGKLVMLGNMYLGARLVIEGELSMGQLIAFNMLAGQVAQPVMRITQLWTDFQQIGISMQRLGDILNTRSELAQGRGLVPNIRGGIQFDKVSFRYSPEGQQVLRNVSLNILPGEVIGVVGRSGSGKSTLTRLIQRLYVPESGRVLVDGVDLATVDSTALRRQIGVVLQDNVLFNRSIQENIALVDPGAPLHAVMQAARLAGAHEFIVNLPEGYATLVGEHGSNLSGGQRQRLAIARALLSNPRILIFDEATSALDYESESIIQKNMAQICKGRTVIIIAHRLSAVRRANRIVSMDQGAIVEIGTHAELLERPSGLYAHLNRIQSS